MKQETIPKQLQNSNLNFVLLGKPFQWGRYENVNGKNVIVEKRFFDPSEYNNLVSEKIWKPLGKAPFESGWQNKKYQFNDSKLQNHLNNGNNIGVIGGHGNLIFVDIDNKKLAEEILNKTNTFTVKTGTGGIHLYFLCDYDENHVLEGDKGEVRAKNYLVVCPNMQHPNGNFYKIIKNINIHKISREELSKLITPYIRNKNNSSKILNVEKPTDQSRSGREFGEICKLIKNGYSKEEIFKKMLIFKKWTESGDDYRERTYNAGRDKVKSKPVKIELDKGYIFDENKIIRDRVFVQDKINDNVFVYGFQLPREIVKEKKDGTFKNIQILSPVILTSDKNNRLIELDSEILEKDYKTKFNIVPKKLDRRFSLKGIKKYIDNEEEEINIENVFNEIKNLYKKYVYFKEEAFYDIHALWDIGTYCFMLFSNYPIFELRGLKGTAKSKIMTISMFITFNPPRELMINPSESTLFRETNDKRITKYIDEAEKLFAFNKNTGRVEPDTRAELLNASYSKNGAVPRQEKIGNKYETEWYSCYSATMIGSINGLRGATESRSITHITTKNPKNDKRGNTEPIIDQNNKIWQEIRDKLYMYFLQNWKKVESEYINFQSDTDDIEARNLQIWKPLLVLSKLINNDIYESVRKFAVNYSIQKTDDNLGEGTLDYNIVIILKNLIYEKKDTTSDNKVYVKDIWEKYLNIYDSNIKKGFTKTISNRVFNLGFTKKTLDTNRGTFYEISWEEFKKTIEPQCPGLFEGNDE